MIPTVKGRTGQPEATRTSTHLLDDLGQVAATRLESGAGGDATAEATDRRSEGPVRY